MHDFTEKWIFIFLQNYKTLKSGYKTLHFFLLKLIQSIDKRSVLNIMWKVLLFIRLEVKDIEFKKWDYSTQLNGIKLFMGLSKISNLDLIIIIFFSELFTFFSLCGNFSFNVCFSILFDEKHTQTRTLARKKTKYHKSCINNNQTLLGNHFLIVF